MELTRHPSLLHALLSARREGNNELRLCRLRCIRRHLVGLVLRLGPEALRRTTSAGRCNSRATLAAPDIERVGL